MTESKSRRRAPLKHALIPVNMLNEHELIDLSVEFGAIAQLYAVKLILALSGARDAEITRNTAIGIGLSIGFSKDECCRFIAHVLANGFLIEHGPMLSRCEVIADQEKLARKQDKWADDKRAQRGVLPSVRADNTPDTPKTDTRTPVRSPERSLNILKDLDLNKKLSSIPEPTRSELLQRIPLWVTHRASIGRALGETEIEALILDCLRDPDRELLSLRTSTKNGHKTLYTVNPNSAEVRAGSPKAKAYRDVLALASRLGRSQFEQAKKQLSAEVLAAVRKAGGWGAFCESDTPELRASFMEALP